VKLNQFLGFAYPTSKATRPAFSIDGETKIKKTE